MAIHELPTDITGNGHGLLEGIGLWAYVVTNGAFWALALAVFCICLIAATLRYGGTRAFAFGSVVGALAATYLAIAHFLSWGIASIFMIVGFIGFVIMIINER